MIFEEIVLNNFGIYKGRHTINLIPEVDSKKRKPIILFGALNGSGKTTLVDALQLALYGNSASQSNRGNVSYPNYLESLINKSVEPQDGAAIELSMRIQRHQRDENIRLIRYWYKNGKGVKENFEVRRDGEVDSFSTEHWDEVVEEIIPRGIAHLFFFDGERIEQLADTDNAANIIETGLHTLLGLDLVDRLSTDLLLIERRRKKTLLSKSDQKIIEQYEEEVSLLQQEADDYYQQVGSENNKLQKIENELEKLRKKYIKSGGGLLDSRKSFDIDLRASEERLISVNSQLKELAAKSAPLLLVQDLLEEVHHQVTQEEELKQIKETSQVLKSRDGSLVKYLKTKDVNEEVTKSIIKYLKEDREKRVKYEELHVFIETPSKYFTHLSSDELQATLNSIEKLVVQSGEFSDEIYKLEEKISAVPSEEQLTDLINNIDRTSQLFSKQQNTVDLLDKQYAFTRDKIGKKKEELERLLEKNLEVDIANEKNTRVIKHIDKVRETLKIFRGAVADKHIHVLENLILESFLQLIRKSNFVREIKIEAETFKLVLIDNEGNTLDAKKLSAGERQLLAVSILWGLAKASGRPLPTVIDTPLGRLDTKHRENLVKYYFPNASHQVILLSTDTEIIDDYYKALKPAVKRTYQIDFDENNQSSNISSGYFS